MAMKVVKQVSFLAACASTALAMQDRNVYFVNSGSVDYELSSYSLSSRRRTTWGGVYNEFDHLNIQASSPISKHGAQSEYFLQDLGPTNVVGSGADSAYPSELKFAVKGSLSMNVGGVMVTCEDIRIGKATKWWLAGSNCLGGNKGTDPLVCICRDGARVRFESKSSSGNNKFKVSLDSPCGLIAERTGFWVAVTAASQTMSWTYTAASSTFTEEEFQLSLTAKYSNAFTFGSLEMSAESFVSFVTQTTQSEYYTHTCEITVPTGMRLWMWTYSVTSGCGISTMTSCYHINLPINDSPPCCLVGYQSNVSTVCTQPGYNMCDGSRRLAPLLV